jgi:hypothetical protein
LPKLAFEKENDWKNLSNSPTNFPVLIPFEIRSEPMGASKDYKETIFVVKILC